MEFRELAGKRLRRPSLDPDDLTPETASFKGAFELESVRVVEGDDSGVLGEGSLSTVLLSHVNLSSARLAPLELSNVTFDHVDLSNAAWPRTTARQVEIVHCQTIGVQLSFVQASDVYVEGCRFDYATIRFDRIKNPVAFRGCLFTETVLTGDLSNVIFDDCDLQSVEFDVSGANGCDLSTSRLGDVRGLLGLRGARIDVGQASALGPRIAAEAGLSVRD